MKINWIARICLAFIAGTSFTGVFAQLSSARPVSTAVDHLVPTSPEVSALEKYVAIPVGLYTGTPEIAIPVYELREGDLTVSAALSYHAAGHKVDDIAPRTGMGWTLQAGGVISRTIFGQADEYSLDGFLKFSERNTPMDILAGPADKQFQLKDQLTNCADAEPDQFSFNFAGYTGKFAFDWSGNLVVSCDKKIRIEPIGLIPGDFSFIQGWLVTGTDGTVYRFDAKESTHITSQSNSLYACQHPFDNPPVSAWHLTKMTSANGYEIFFQYEAYQMQYNMRMSETTSHKDYIMPATTNYNIERMTVNGQNLRKIYTASGDSLLFINGTEPRTDVPGSSGQRLRSLAEIKAVAKAGLRKHLKLGYDYSIGRLTLKSIQELPVDGSSPMKPPHRFIYSGALPQFSSDASQPATFFSQDHWGYYNGNSKNMLTPPYMFTNSAGSIQTYEGGDRSPSATRMSAGILTQIIYPTGGTSTFDYEPHRYGFIRSTPLTEKELVNKSVSVQRAGSENTTYQRQFTTHNFHVGGVTDKGVRLNIEIHFCSEDFGSANLGPWVSLHKATGETIRSWVLESDGKTGYIQLSPGDYYFRLSTMGAECPSGGYDWASASLSWDEFTGRILRLDRMAGGLRVKRISDYDGLDHANDIIRKFDYTMDEAGQSVCSGVIFEEPRYEYATLIHEGPDDSYNPQAYLTRISNNCIALGATHGSHIGYRQVNVLYGETGDGGKTESTFTSIFEFPDHIQYEAPFAPASSYDFSRGLLKKQVDYKYENGSYQPVRQIENEYDSDDGLTQIPAYKVGLAVSGGGLFGETFLFRYAVGGYSVNLSFRTLKKNRETRFSEGQEFVTESNFEYDADHQFLIREWVKGSDDKEQITEYSYPLQYTDPSNAVVADMKSRHILSPVIETVSTEKAGDGSLQVIDAAFTEFGFFGNRIFPLHEWRFKAKTPVADFIRSVDNAAKPDLRYYYPTASFDRYNHLGNPEQVTSTGEVVTSYLWGYDGRLLVAQVLQATYNRSAFAGFEHGDQGRWVYSDQGVVSSDSKTGTRSFKGTIGTMLPLEAGQYRVSLWAKGSSNGQIVVNGIPKNITAAWKRYEWILTNPGTVSLTTNGNLIDDLRLHPAEAQMKTFTYYPQSILSSVTDENHSTTFYEYDGLMRLKVVRDQDGNILKHHQYHYSEQ